MLRNEISSSTLDNDAMLSPYAWLAGYFHGLDCNRLRNDSMFKVLCGPSALHEEPLPGQSTQSRFENSVSRSDLYRLAEQLVELFIKSYRKPSRWAKTLCCSDCVKSALPQTVAWADARIVTMKNTPTVRGHGVASVARSLGWRQKKGIEDVRDVIINVQGRRASHIYSKVYCKRGQAENWIKDHKNALRSDLTSCHRFVANQFRVLLHSLAYVLLHHFRERSLRNTELARSQMDTIRYRLLKIGAQVTESARRIRFHLPSGLKNWSVIHTVCTKLDTG